MGDAEFISVLKREIEEVSVQLEELPLFPLSLVRVPLDGGSVVPVVASEVPGDIAVATVYDFRFES